MKKKSFLLFGLVTGKKKFLKPEKETKTKQKLTFPVSSNEQKRQVLNKLGQYRRVLPRCRRF